MESKKWDDRYAENGYAYGAEPNAFFKYQLDHLSPGKILLPADGEGRNGVYAALKGWQSTSFDISIEGQKKALQLATDLGTTIDYQVGDFQTMGFQPLSFDCMALIYAHFPGPVKSDFHQKLSTLVKPGGIVIFEAFSKNHLPLVQANPAVGGPKDLDTLFSLEELDTDFHDYEVLYRAEETVALNEGKYHRGQASVIRFVGKKH